jgi:hypothetical protein
MRTAANNVIRVGRATMLAIGMGVSLALVLGVATVALAAVPGDPFKLGQVNIINGATTTLQGNGLSGPLSSSVLNVKRDGSTSGPGLTVDNTSTSGAARGIDINVPNGEMPINVNSAAGKSDLNVDKLDGEDRTDFLSASRVYKVSSGLVQGQDGDGASVLVLAGMRCDNGDVAIGGGGNANDIEDDLNAVIPASTSSYQIEFQDNGNPSKFAGFVLCSDSTSPFRN